MGLANQTDITVGERTPFVSVIVASRRDTETLRRCLSALERQTYPKEMFEIIVASVSACSVEKKEPLIKNVVCGSLNQAEARDVAERYARGEILAFCDDDCVVPQTWLRDGVRHFAKDKMLATVGGPAVPPIDGVSIRQAVAGLLHMSYLGTGSHSYAFTTHGRVEPFLCLPTHIIGANMFVDRKKFREVGGFGKLVPQEEDRLNNKLLRKGYKLLYDPQLTCIHYQRRFGLGYIKNLFWLAKGSGRFAKENFRALNKLYLMPAVFTLSILLSPLLIALSQTFLNLFIIAAAAYILVVAVESPRLVRRKREHKMLTALIMPLAFFLHHFVFGLGWIAGLLSRRRYGR